MRLISSFRAQITRFLDWSFRLPVDTPDMREFVFMTHIQEDFPRWKEFTTSPHCGGQRFKVLLEEYRAIIRDKLPNNNVVPHMKIMARLYENWENT